MAGTAAGCVARAGCARCPEAIEVRAADAATVLRMLLARLADEAWGQDAKGRRLCPACALLERRP